MRKPTWAQEPRPRFCPQDPPCSSQPTPEEKVHHSVQILNSERNTCSRRHSKNTLLLSTMLMYSTSSFPQPATFLSRSFSPSKSAACKSSILTSNVLAKETHVDFAVRIEIKELLEEVSELLPLEWRQEPLQFIDVGDVVGALGGEVGAHHRAHLALSHCLAPNNWGKAWRGPECLVQRTRLVTGLGRRSNTIDVCTKVRPFLRVAHPECATGFSNDVRPSLPLPAYRGFSSPQKFCFLPKKHRHWTICAQSTDYNNVIW